MRNAILTLITATLLYPAHAAVLTCTSPDGYIYPRETVNPFSVTDFSSYPDYNRPALRFATTPPYIPFGPTEMVLLTVKITDNKGTIYAAPRWEVTEQGYPVLASPTPTPKGATLSASGTYSISPASGQPFRTEYGATARMSIQTISPTNVQQGNQNDIVNYVLPVKISQTNSSYTVSNSHDFGDIAPSTSGTPLVLPAPSTGSLLAAILWNGPAGTSMTQKIGSGSAIDVKPGSTYQLDTAGKGLQLDLKASDTASPGAITGNLTLTLTCP